MTNGHSNVRVEFVDGLRGIAILMVVFYHFYYLQLTLTEEGNSVLLFVNSLTRIGKMGVYVFFVISGFIVSYVTFNKVHNWRYITNFILRRQVRLDPPFWLAIGLAIFIAWLSIEMLGNKGHKVTGYDILTNVTYTFDILGFYDIIRVGWTLCIEVQFYLTFILLVFFMRLSGLSRLHSNVFYYLLFLGSIAALALLEKQTDMYIINYWFVFFLGIAVAFNVKKVISNRFYILLLLTPFVFMPVFPSMNPMVVVFSTITSLGIFLAFKTGNEKKWLSSKFFQFFGMISYSLYLTHCIIGNRVVRYLTEKLNWNEESLGITFVIVLVSFAICMFFAVLFYYGIEKRSIQWSKRISLRQAVNG